MELNPIKATLKSGEEALSFKNKKVGYTLLDFWKWSVSDIISNATRGRFAEFIVGTAIDLNIESLREEWDAYDLITDYGAKIEVKSASYIQSWKQKDFSTISFSIKPTSHFENQEMTQRSAIKRHSDLYIFCLLKHKEQESIDPLRLEQWEFYILPTYKIDNYKRSQSSITLKSLQKLVNPIFYNELKQKIKASFDEQIAQNTNLFIIKK